MDDPFLLLTSIGNNLAAFNLQPAWIGNLTAIGATRVNVDLMSPASSAPLAMRLVLFGPGSVDDRWTSVVSQAVPNDGVWRTIHLVWAKAISLACRASARTPSFWPVRSE